MEHYKDGMTSGTFKFKWLIKNNRLFHGWLEGKKDALDIDLYPTIANTTIVSEYNTVFPGNEYMILEGEYYIKR